MKLKHTWAMMLCIVAPPMAVRRSFSNANGGCAAASVVSVVNKRRQGDLVVEDSVGSGFIWDERGHIVTNWHCVQPTLQDQTNKLVKAFPLFPAMPPTAGWLSFSPSRASPNCCAHVSLGGKSASAGV